MPRTRPAAFPGLARALAKVPAERRSAAIRVSLAVGLAAALTCLAIVALWGPFDTRTDVVGLDPDEVDYEYAGGDRGWKGDVPVVRIDTARIRKLGWQNAMSSAEALRESMLAMLPEARAGRL